MAGVARLRRYAAERQAPPQYSARDPASMTWPHSTHGRSTNTRRTTAADRSRLRPAAVAIRHKPSRSVTPASSWERSQIGRSALPPTKILPMHGGDQLVEAVRAGEASRVPVLLRIRPKILKKRLPPWLRGFAFRDTRPTWVDVLAAPVAPQDVRDSHASRLPHSLSECPAPIRQF
jgi:hypothetical protein